MGDTLLILWLHSHVIMDTLCLGPVQGHARLLETGNNQYQHAHKVTNIFFQICSFQYLTDLCLIFIYLLFKNEFLGSGYIEFVKNIHFSNLYRT